MFAEWVAVLKLVGTMFLVGLVIEWFAPKLSRVPVANLVFNAIYGMFCLFLAVSLIPWLGQLTAPVAAGFTHKLHLQFPGGWAGSVLAQVTFLLVYDFFYYWWHRAQHEFSWLWPVHELHHSERTLNVTSTIRHHWLEEPIRMFTVLLPLSLLFKIDPPQIALVFTLLTFWGYFVHLNCRLELGALTGVIAGPQYHRVHHSIETKHYNRNYAAFFPIFDRMFGTQHRPKPGEWPDTGIDSMPIGDNWVHAYFGPMLAWWKMVNARLQATK